MSISRTLEQWISAHKDNYVAHAIWADNIEKVLRSGELIPSELQLRKNYQVSYEQGVYASRMLRDISPFIAELKELAPTIAKRVVLTSGVPLKSALEFNILTPRQMSKISTFSDDSKEDSCTVTLCDEKEYLVTGKGEDTKINGIPYLKSGRFYGPEWHDYSATLRALHEKYELPSSVIQCAIDEFSGQPIDKDLAKVWDAFSPLFLTSDTQNLIERLISFRNDQIQTNSLNEDVRASYSSIFWGYGNVVVLRGNPSNILSSIRKPRKGYEVSLLNPYENKGEFYSLNLSDKDIIVLGPRHILAPHQEHAKSKGINLVDLESLTKEQLALFNVPSKLQPQRKKAMEKIQNVFTKVQDIKTSKILKHWQHVATEFKKAEEVKQVMDDKKIASFREKWDAIHVQSSFKFWEEKARTTKAKAWIKKYNEEEAAKAAKNKLGCIVM